MKTKVIYCGNFLFEHLLKFLTIFFTVEDMIKEVDVDGDGKIDFYEFVHALGEPEDSQDIDEEDEFLNSPLPTPKSNDPSFSDILSQ